MGSTPPCDRRLKAAGNPNSCHGLPVEPPRPRLRSRTVMIWAGSTRPATAQPASAGSARDWARSRGRTGPTRRKAPSSGSRDHAAGVDRPSHASRSCRTATSALAHRGADPDNRRQVAGVRRYPSRHYGQQRLHQELCRNRDHWHLRVRPPASRRDITPFGPVLKHVAGPAAGALSWRTCRVSRQQHFGDSRAYGLIAQDVEAVLPELVVTGEDGFKAVDYTKLPLLTIQAVKELKAEKDALQQRVDELERLLKEILATTADR